MGGGIAVTHLLGAARVGGTCEAVTTSPLPHERTDGPSRGALLDFCAELKRIAQAKAQESQKARKDVADAD